MKRCKWCNIKNKLYIKYHDEEWCKPNFNDKYLYEMLIVNIRNFSVWTFLGVHTR